MVKLSERFGRFIAKTKKIFRSGYLSINESSARKIQKQASDKRNRESLKIASPAYKKIAEQLSSEKEQIFEAALYYFGKIAQNSHKHKGEIIKIMQDFAALPSTDEKRREAVLSKIPQL